MEHNKLGPGRPSRQAVYQRLEEGVAELRDRLGGLPLPAEAEDIWTAIWYQEAHHSTALEGNTLVLQQVELLLAEGRAVGNKELREYMEVRGYADAARWVYGQALDPGEWKPEAQLTLTEARHVHELALGPVWGVSSHPSATPKEKPGGFREHDIQPFPGGMTPASWVEVPAAMADWVRSFKSIAGSDNPIERVAAAHAEFERIHPFLDGNGRTGRLLMNLVLVRFGYPPAIIYIRDRNRYLNALRRADGGEPGPLGEMVARAVSDNLYRFVVPAVDGPRRLVPLAALATKERRVSTMRAAIERGRLRAQKGPDGQWRSSKAWVDEYLASKYQRRQRRN
jgi:fido (protein-threonine AMPylation protein)